VHIPKTGGSSLECTFSQRESFTNPCLGKLDNRGMQFELLGVHENYEEVVGHVMSCVKDETSKKVIYKK
jgi:hypothetical protein